MDHEVVPWPSKRCDWMLKSSREDLGLHQGKMAEWPRWLRSTNVFLNLLYPPPWSNRFSVGTNKRGGPKKTAWAHVKKLPFNDFYWIFLMIFFDLVNDFFRLQLGRNTLNTYFRYDLKHSRKRLFLQPFFCKKLIVCICSFHHCFGLLQLVVCDIFEIENGGLWRWWGNTKRVTRRVVTKLWVDARNGSSNFQTSLFNFRNATET